MEYDLTNRFSLAFLFVTAVLWVLAAVALRHRERRDPRLLAVVLLVMSLWSLGDAVRFGAPGRASILFWDRVSDTGIIFLSPAIFFFVASYTGRHRWLQRKYVASLLLVSGGFFVVAATNPLHGLWATVESIDPGTPPPVFVEGRGYLWYVFAVYGPSLAAASYYLLFTKMAEEERDTLYRSQTLLVGIGILTPILLTAFYLIGVVSYDPTPFGFLVSGVTFGLSIYRYDLLDISPVARDTAVSTTSNGILVVDRNETVADANDALAEIFGSSRQDLLGTSLSTLRAEYPRLLEPVTDPQTTNKIVTIRDDGKRRHYDITVSGIRTAVEADAGQVVIFNDMTDTIRQRNKLLERTAELERQNERLDQFASMVSHDLRNPLQVASSSLDLAEKGCPEEDFAAVRAAHDRMDAMIEDLLSIARAGKTIEETTSVAVAEIATESWGHVETASADLDVAVPEDWTLQSDPDRLRHVFENLFRNAVEHGSSGANSERRQDAVEHDASSQVQSGDSDFSLTVRVGILDGSTEGFYVEDDGDGIPEDERDNIFNHGYTASEGGTGFGLTIVSEVVEAHGWEIDVGESSTGGARFEIYTATQPERDYTD